MHNLNVSDRKLGFRDVGLGLDCFSEVGLM